MQISEDATQLGFHVSVDSILLDLHNSSHPNQPHYPSESDKSSTILVKNLETHLYVCWFGYYSGLSASKYAWLNIGEAEGTLQWEQKSEE